MLYVRPAVLGFHVCLSFLKYLANSSASSLINVSGSCWLLILMARFYPNPNPLYILKVSTIRDFADRFFKG